METPNRRRPNAGHFRKGHDPRRHKFSREECQRGFWNAVYSIITRHPDAVDSAGRHIACGFLKVAGRQSRKVNAL